MPLTLNILACTFYLFFFGTYILKTRTSSLITTERRANWEILTLIQYYYLEYGPYSNFTNYPNNVLHVNFLPWCKIQSRITHFIYVSSLFSLFQSGTVLRSFFFFFNFHDLNIFEKLSYKISQVWCVWNFLSQIQVKHFGPEEHRDAVCPSRQLVPQGDQLVKVVPLHLSTVKLLYISL